MKNSRCFLFIFFILSCVIIINSVSASTNVPQCAILSTVGETYLVNTSFTNTTASACFNITANNITLNCQGYTLTGNRTADNISFSTNSLYAIFSNSSNIMIKNCNISRWVNGINITNSDNITIYNNSFIYLYGIYNLTSDDGGDANGIWSKNNSNVNISMNNFSYIYGGKSSTATVNNLRGGASTGIFIINSTGNLTNNNISYIYGGQCYRAASSTYQGYDGNDYGIFSSNINIINLNNNNVSFIGYTPSVNPPVYGSGGQCAGSNSYGIYGNYLNITDVIIYNISGTNARGISGFVKDNQKGIGMNLTNSYIYNSKIINISGGEGTEGNFPATGGSDPGESIGLLLNNCSIFNTNVSNVYAGEPPAFGSGSGNPVPSYGLYAVDSNINNSIINGVFGGRDGGTASYPGTAGDCYGFYLDNSSMNYSDVYDLYAGTLPTIGIQGKTFIFEILNSSLYYNSFHGLRTPNGTDNDGLGGVGYASYLYGTNHIMKYHHRCPEPTKFYDATNDSDVLESLGIKP